MRQQNVLRRHFGWVAAIAMALGAASAGCGFNPNSTGGTPGTGGHGQIPGIGGGVGPVAACDGLRCRQSTCSKGDCVQPACGGGALTRLLGKVYDPAGKVPLYNISVYVPNKPLAPYSDGPSCDGCATMLSGDPVVQATTDASGSFVLGSASGDVPTGDNVPLVIQVGQMAAGDHHPPRRRVHRQRAHRRPNLTRLPAQPAARDTCRKIALTTGGADALECLLRKIGIDDAEFTPTSGSGPDQPVQRRRRHEVIRRRATAARRSRRSTRGGTASPT